MGEKNGRVRFLAKCTKTARKVKKTVILQNLLRKVYINRKPLIWSKDKIIMKFGEKHGRVWFLAKCMKTAGKVMKSVILQNLHRRE